MLASEFKFDSPQHREIIANPQDWAIEPKLDGMRAVLEVTENRQVGQFMSRTGKSVYEKLPRIVAIINQSGWMPGWYDMELGWPAESVDKIDLYPRIDFNKTMRILGSGVPKAIAEQREAEWPIVAYVFDYYDPTHPNYVYQDRIKFVDLMVSRTGHSWIQTSYIAQGYMTSFPIFETVFEQIVAEGGEGAMLKNINGLYVPGKRSKGWLKWKKYETIDAYVVGYDEGQGKYEGMVGALYFSDTPYGKSLGKCSGMTDAERQEWTQLFDLYGEITRLHHKDRLIEVKHYGKLVDGLRHPQYSKWKRAE